MLILQRRRGEIINIGDDIEIHITKIDAWGVAHVGIIAPKSIDIFRNEVYVRLKSGEKRVRKSELI